MAVTWSLPINVYLAKFEIEARRSAAISARRSRGT
jgi:hypothetical protein